LTRRRTSRVSAPKAEHGIKISDGAKGPSHARDGPICLPRVRVRSSA
jgi:hypothetical protein